MIGPSGGEINLTTVSLRNATRQETVALSIELQSSSTHRVNNVKFDLARAKYVDSEVFDLKPTKGLSSGSGVWEGISNCGMRIAELGAVGVLEYWSIGVLEYWCVGSLSSQRPTNRRLPIALVLPREHLGDLAGSEEFVKI
jgi:hypothetical protein